MTYTFNRLRDKHGVSIRNPKSVAGVTLDIDKERRAYVFSGSERGDLLLGKLNVMEFEAHAAGLFLRGTESDGTGLKFTYQE
jgi:hypothetical protein